MIEDRLLKYSCFAGRGYPFLRFRSSRLLFWVGSLAVTVRLVDLGPGVQWASTSSEDVFLPYLSSEGLPAAINERLICQVANALLSVHIACFRASQRC